MAIFRLEAKIISRGGGKTSAVGAAAYQSGKCATSAAAYRAGDAMTDERTGQSFDYSKKRGVLGAEILLPEGAPDWMQDRSRLWNAVEAVERRKDSQLARDFIVSLPHELDHEQRRALLRGFVEEHLTSKGYVADCAYHAPPKGDDLNWHAHVMVPLRKVTADGFAAKKERPEGNPTEAWKAQLVSMRADWAERVNLALEAAGSDARIDHRSNAAQGLDREPEPKLGPIAAKIEAEGRESHAGQDLREVRARNAAHGALRHELSGVTAEIIDLQAERIRRMETQQPDENVQPEPTDPGTYQKQRDKVLDHIRTIEAQASQASEEMRLREEMNRKNQQQAEDEKKHRAQYEQEKKDATANGDVTDPGLRYAQALGQHYDIKDPYGSLARAAMAEYGAFAKQQQQLKLDAHNATDPTQKQAIDLQARIEGADYMWITSRRLGSMSDVISGQAKSENGNRDREAAAIWKQQGEALRQERAELQRQQHETEQTATRDKAAEAERRAEANRANERFSGRYNRDKVGGAEQTDRKAETSDRAQATTEKESTPRETGDRQQGSPGAAERGPSRTSGGRGR